MSKYKISLVAFIILCLLSSCGIYTTYKRPENLPVQNLYRDSVAQSDSGSLAVLSWRELFTDPQLVEWIELGLENNTDLRIARLKVEEASAALSASKQTFLPSLGISTQGNLSRYDGATASKTYSLEVSSDWEIDLFGRLRNAKRQDMAALEQSESYKQAVQTQLITTIADTYYSLQMLDRQLDITKRTVENWEKNVTMMSALKEAGETNSAAISQAKANKLTAEQSILALEKQIYTLENSFSSLLGLVPQDIKRSEYFDLNIPSEYSLGVPLEMIGNRPDVKVAEYDLVKAFYATNEVRSNFYPQIILGGSTGWTNSVGNAITNPGSWLWNAVGTLIQPLFNKGKNIANLKMSKAQQEEALLSYWQKILDAGTEVNDALKQWQTAQKNLELSRQKIKELENTVQSTQLLMQYGHINYLEILTAQQSLLEAQLQEVSDQFDEIQGVITLYHALGGGTK